MRQPLIIGVFSGNHVYVVRRKRYCRHYWGITAASWRRVIRYAIKNAWKIEPSGTGPTEYWL